MNMNNKQIKIYENYGKRIFNQEIGTKVGKKIIQMRENDKVSLNFEGVESINTAFWNALLSEIIKENKDANPSAYFTIINTNETIRNTLVISLQLLEYFENSDR